MGVTVDRDSIRSSWDRKASLRRRRSVKLWRRLMVRSLVRVADPARTANAVEQRGRPPAARRHRRGDARSPNGPEEPQGSIGSGRFGSTTLRREHRDHDHADGTCPAGEIPMHCGGRTNGERSDSGSKTNVASAWRARICGAGAWQAIEAAGFWPGRRDLNSISPSIDNKWQKKNACRQRLCVFSRVWR